MVVISLGTAGTCSFNADFNVIGIAIMFAAELAEAIRLIFTQYFLQQLKFGVVEGVINHIIYMLAFVFHVKRYMYVSFFCSQVNMYCHLRLHSGCFWHPIFSSIQK